MSHLRILEAVCVAQQASDLRQISNGWVLHLRLVAKSFDREEAIPFLLRHSLNQAFHMFP